MTNRSLAALVVLGLALSACGDATSAGREDGLAGEIIADGSSTVFPITQAVAEEFGSEAPDVRVSVGTSGTGGGFEKFCRGETDISNASRRIKDEEAAVCRKNGVEYAELTVAIDGLSLVVNPENDWATCLTVDELKRIWEPASAVDNWRDVRGGFPDRPLALYGPGTDSGTFDYFTDAIVGEEGKSRSDYTASEDDNVLVQGVSGDPDALGYFGFAYYEQNQQKLRALAVDGGGGCVAPTDGTIKGGTYKPLSRPLFVYVAKKSAGRPEVKAFIDFFLGSGLTLVADVGYVPLPPDQVERATRTWKTFAP